MAEKSNTAWLRPFLRPMRKVFAEMLTMTVFINLMALVVPVFTMQVYDRVIGSAGISTLWGLVIGVGVIMIFDFVMKQSRSRIMQTVALRVDVEVGKRLFNKVTALPLDKLEVESSGYWQSLFKDVDMIRNVLSGAPAILLADLPFTLVFFAIIWVIAAPIVPFLAVIWCIYIFIAWRSSAVMNAANQEERQSAQTRDAIINEMIAGRTTIKALGLERTMRPLWEFAAAENIERASSRGGKTDGFSNFGTILSTVTTVGMTAIGALFIIKGDLTMGSLIAANMLSGRLLGPLNQLVGTWRIYSSFQQAAGRLGDIFDSESDRIENEIEMDRPIGEIALEDVKFGYGEEGPNVVDGVKIGIRPGGLTAIVGRNGCGKTTMIKLIQGLYKPRSGRVLLDGADIAQFSREQLVEWVGYVPQETVLFAGTVRDNIAYGTTDPTDEKIIDAATKAGVHKFIIDLPDGYGSEIGEAGQRLSGGQRQRISIARALVSNPAVLLLDEPSSNLDRQAEEELRTTLKELAEEHTVIVVSHSPVLLQGCDNLIALDRGKIALAGPAKEILPRLFGARKPQGQDDAKGQDKKPESSGDKPTASPADTGREKAEAKPDTPAPAAPPPKPEQPVEAAEEPKPQPKKPPAPAQQQAVKSKPAPTAPEKPPAAKAPPAKAEPGNGEEKLTPLQKIAAERLAEEKGANGKKKVAAARPVSRNRAAQQPGNGGAKPAVRNKPRPSARTGARPKNEDGAPQSPGTNV